MIARFALVLALAAFSLAAAPMNCQTDTLANYMANYGSTGCMVDSNYLVNNFSYVGVTAFANPVTAANILVTPSSGSNGPGLAFSASWQVAGVAGVSEALLLYTISSVTPFSTLSQMNLTAQGSRTALGSATVTEVNCEGGLLNLRQQSAVYSGLPSVACTGGGVRSQTSALLPLGSNLTASGYILFASAVTQVDVLKDIALTGVLGSASVTSLGQSFTATSTGTPEPATAALLGCGLLCIAFARRSKAN